MKAAFGLLLVLGLAISLPSGLYGQELESDTITNPMDQLGTVSDAFQENFFEGLKQKAIENYELALTALAKAEKAAKTPENKAVVYFEMGKNHALLNEYAQAEKNFEKVLASQGDRLDVLEQLYDLYYQQQDFEKAIPLVKKLIPFDEDYKEDLANLYATTKQYKKALQQLDELDAMWGESDLRNALRTQIYRATGDTQGAIDNLEQKIGDNPKNEREYLKLIFFYSEQGDSEKAFATALDLLKAKPKSQLVHLALYKFYLDKEAIPEALESMKVVFSSEEIDQESKYKVLGDFILYVNEHPQLEPELENMATLFSEENGGKVYEKLGDYFSAKMQKEKALAFYEKGVALTPLNYNLLKNTILLQIDTQKFGRAVSLSQEGLDNFPAQALLYLLNGVAHNALHQPDQALESLESGLDFILEDPQMQRDFYKQLSLAYSEKGDLQKAKLFTEKAAQIP